MHEWDCSPISILSGKAVESPQSRDRAQLSSIWLVYPQLCKMKLLCQTQRLCLDYFLCRPKNIIWVQVPGKLKMILTLNQWYGHSVIECLLLNWLLSMCQFWRQAFPHLSDISSSLSTSISVTFVIVWTSTSISFISCCHLSSCWITWDSWTGSIVVYQQCLPW